MANHDYKKPATDVKLHAYAIGIRSKDPLLSLKAKRHHAKVSNTQHGSLTAEGAGPLCGGGVKVTRTAGAGNLVQMSYPSKTDSWKVENKDHDSSVSKATSRAFVISLRRVLRYDRWCRPGLRLVSADNIHRKNIT